MTFKLTANRQEWPALIGSFAYFFCLLCGYYIIRPVRDEMGIQAGLASLPWLFTVVFFVMAMLALPLALGGIFAAYRLAKTHEKIEQNQR
jgi:ATP/ADP translocase